MQRTSSVVLVVFGVIAAVLLVLGLVFGPGLYREGRAFVGPIVELSRSEERMTELNNELPFSPPPAGTLDEERFAVFMEIRRELEPHYLRWERLERRLERQGEDDWETAKEVLGVVREIAGIQIATLRRHGMSPAEFNWIEDLAYGTWLDAVAAERQGGEVVEALRASASEDLEYVAGLKRRYGSSPAIREIEQRLEQRVDRLDDPVLPQVEGVSDETSRLLWRHRDELAELDLAARSELHDMLRGGDVDIELGSE